jgi:hypothetical protein
MPQFVAQILSLDGDVIFSNVDVSMDVSPQGLEWRGNFDLPPTSTFDPNSLPQRTKYKIQLHDGRTGAPHSPYKKSKSLISGRCELWVDEPLSPGRAVAMLSST